MTQFKETQDKIKSLKPGVIINAAGYTNVDKAEAEEEIANKINGSAVGNLAKITRELEIPLIHFSTDYVFDGEREQGYVENDKPNPINAYGRSKLLGDELLQKNTDKFYLLRLSWLYGQHGRNFINTIVRLGKERKTLKVVNDQFGRPTYALDVAERVKWFIENKPEYGIYHITNEGKATWYDLAKKSLELKNVDTLINPCTTEEYLLPAKRPKYSVLLNTKLEPMRHWENALRDYLGVS